MANFKENILSMYTTEEIRQEYEMRLIRDSFVEYNEQRQRDSMGLKFPSKDVKSFNADCSITMKDGSVIKGNDGSTWNLNNKG